MRERLDEIQTIHIAKACQFLRQRKEEFRINNPDDLSEVVEKARRLARLNINNWTIRTEEVKGLRRPDGKRTGAWAESLYYQDNVGLGVLSARQVDLKIDREQLKREGISLPDAVAREMFRVVLNPYGPPDPHAIQEKQLSKIMKALKKLGWGK